MTRKISSDVRLYYGGYDPGLSTTSIGYTLGVEVLDPTALPDAAERVLGGKRTDSVEWSGLFDNGSDDLDAAQKVLIATGTAVMSLLVGTGTGDVAYSGTAYLLAAKPAVSIGELVKMEASFKPDQSWDRCANYVQGGKKTVTATENGPQVDNGAATTNGGNFYVHVFTLTSPTGTVNVNLDHSTDGTTYATKASSNYTAAGKASGKVSFTGTLNRYARYGVAGTFGTLQFAAVVNRT